VSDLFSPTGMGAVFKALHRDLVTPEGPQIGTIRNQQLAILVYPPEREFELREHVAALTHELAQAGWVVHTLDIYRLFLERLDAQRPGFVERLVAREKMLAEDDRDHALDWLGSMLGKQLEGPEGIARDVSREIGRLVKPEQAERSLVLIGRVGALYPFFRSSALLKHLDGHTRGVPAVLLYPGERRGKAGLSFLGELEPDRDYRPRIYS